MGDKKFVLNADDFGMSEAYNTAIFEGYDKGLLLSTSLVANGDAYNSAASKVVSSYPELGVGVHLNIIEGKALSKDCRELADVNGKFNNSYAQLIYKSYKLNNGNFLAQLENEFRMQIEKVRNSKIHITHIDSHVHTHAIPPIFELVCKLAKEYDIPQVRTQHEHFYTIPDVYMHLNIKYPVNLIKIALLNSFTLINKQNVKKYGLKTNDYLIGVGYTSMMNSLTVSYGLLSIKNKTGITAEALIHPCRYADGLIDNHFTEYRITQNEKLKDKIEKMGYEIGNYRN